MTQTTTHDHPLRRQKTGAMLVFALLACYFGGFFGLFAYQANHYGYGTGLTNQKHVAPEIARAAGFPAGTDTLTLAKATNDTEGGGVWHDTWRLLLSVGLIVGIVLFYYATLSRLGSF